VEALERLPGSSKEGSREGNIRFGELRREGVGELFGVDLGCSRWSAKVIGTAPFSARYRSRAGM
jgi:hypothetical protein